MTAFRRAGGPESNKFWIALDGTGENTVPRARGLVPYLLPCAPGALPASLGPWYPHLDNGTAVGAFRESVYPSCPEMF